MHGLRRRGAFQGRPRRRTGNGRRGRGTGAKIINSSLAIFWHQDFTVLFYLSFLSFLAAGLEAFLPTLDVVDLSILDDWK